jgi:hypothetical protein
MYILRMFCNICAVITQSACVYTRSFAMSYQNRVCISMKYLAHFSVTEPVRNSIGALN